MVSEGLPYFAQCLSLDTPRLRLRQFTDADFNDYAALCAHGEVMRFVGDRLAREAAIAGGDRKVKSDIVLETPRLQLRHVALSDACFFFRLLNEPSWLENIGDRGIRSEAAAQSYIRNTVVAHYQTYGYGMYAVQLKSTMHPIGICGLVQRDFLSAPDLGFALLPDYVGHGYASEAARALLQHAQNNLGIGRLYAITTGGNQRSIALLDRLGFRHEGSCLTPQGEQLELYAAIIRQNPYPRVHTRN